MPSSPGVLDSTTLLVIVAVLGAVLLASIAVTVLVVICMCIKRNSAGRPAGVAGADRAVIGTMESNMSYGVSRNQTLPLATNNGRLSYDYPRGAIYQEVEEYSRPAAPIDTSR